MTTSTMLTKIRAATSVWELREATAAAIESLSQEKTILERIEALEEKLP